MPTERDARGVGAALVAALSLTCATSLQAADIKVSMGAGGPQAMYRSGVDGCAPIDTPDIDPRAFRDASGGVAMFALHYVNRALRGPDLAHLKIDCAVALDSAHDPEAAHYNDRRYMTATWTDNGRDVVGIVHHEYHADDHRACATTQSIGCWYNTILSFSSRDGGRSFTMDRPAVVAAAPFKQDVEQGRHRGFFNPSNIVSDGRYKYFMASTTGWSGQNYGVCLFRSPNPFDSASWRAWDGADFTVRYGDPYGPRAPAPRPCAIVAPFVFPVGSLVKHAASGRWLAVWMAKKDDGAFPISGFYTSTSGDLRHWSQPRLLLAGPTIHDGACGGSLIAYPSIIDENARTRNFEDAGDSPWLYYVSIKMNGCETGERTLQRERLKISLDERAGVHP